MEPALIGLLGVVVGAVLSNVAERFVDAARRRERVQDVSTAIRAEIRSHRQRLLLFDAAGADAISEKILNASTNPDGYTPFVPSEPHSFVLDAIVGEVHILPTDVIDPVIYYYRQAAALRQFAEDLRGDGFGRLEAPRKAEMYRDYIAMGTHARKLADDAITALEDNQ